MPLVKRLNEIVGKAPKRKLKTIFDKYSHENFFKVNYKNMSFIRKNNRHFNYFYKLNLGNEWCSKSNGLRTGGNLSL